MRQIAPAGALVAAVTGTAYLLHGQWLGAVNPMILAVVLGIAFRSAVTISPRTEAGISMIGTPLLRISIILLGLQITFAELSSIGVSGIATAIAAVIATYFATIALGRFAGIDSQLCHLIASGTSICGASAIAASSTIIRAGNEDVSYAIACVTVLGSVAMLAYPVLHNLLGLGDHNYGIWVGASIHEVAQVVGAGFQVGDEAGQAGIVTKLTRVLMLAPVIVALSAIFLPAHRADGRAPRHFIPPFILLFIAMVAATSLGLVPDAVRQPFMSITPVLFAAAMCAIGLKSDLGKIRQKGIRPFILASVSTILISSGTYLAIFV